MLKQRLALSALAAVLFSAVGLNAATPPRSTPVWPRSSGSSACSTLFIAASHLEQVRHGEKAFGAEAARYALDGNTKNDLNVREMLYPQLNKTVTKLGAWRLAHLLENPFLDETEIVERQKVVQALASDKVLRERLQAALKPLQSFDREFLGLLATGELSQQTPSQMRGRALFNAIITSASTTYALHTMVTEGFKTSILQAFLPMIYLNTSVASHMRNLRPDILPYKNLIEAADHISADLGNLSIQSPLISEIADMLSATTDAKHPQSLAESSAKKLRRVRQSRFMATLDFLYGHSAWTLDGVYKSVLKDRENLASLMSAIAELDVFLALAEVADQNHDTMIFPKIVRTVNDAFFHLEDGHHPYIFANHPHASVPNSATLSSYSSATPNFTILTGPNAGGKSTYLKMIALNAIQGQIGAPVPAKAFVFTPIEALTNIDISDSVETGKSFFRAESRRMAEILERLRAQPKVLIIMDEILLGTNPKDRQAIEEEVIHHMATSGRLALLATHDIEMTRLTNEIPTIENLQVEEVTDANGNFRFSFRIKPGVSQTSTAYEVLRAEGVPADLVERAMKRRLQK